MITSEPWALLSELQSGWMKLPPSWSDPHTLSPYIECCNRITLWPSGTSSATQLVRSTDSIVETITVLFSSVTGNTPYLLRISIGKLNYLDEHHGISGPETTPWPLNLDGVLFSWRCFECFLKLYLYYNVMANTSTKLVNTHLCNSLLLLSLEHQGSRRPGSR